MLTVTEPANQDLVTLDAVKAALGITGTAEDTKLQALISQASAAIAQFCNRVFIEEDVEEAVRTERRDLIILLERYPVTEIISVTENGVALGPYDREIDQASGCLNRLSGDQIACFSQGRVVIAYTAGYTIDKVPPDLVQATVALVAHYRSTGARDPLLRAEETTDIERLEYFIPTTGGLPATVESLITPHRKPAGS